MNEVAEVTQEAPKTGINLAVIGANLAADKAGPTWKKTAYQCLVEVAEQGRPFTSEDVKGYAKGLGIGEPPDPRAWGAVFIEASRKHLIERVGFAPLENPVCHGRPGSVWKKADRLETVEA